MGSSSRSTLSLMVDFAQTVKSIFPNSLHALRELYDNTTSPGTTRATAFADPVGALKVKIEIQLWDCRVTEAKGDTIRQKCLVLASNGHPVSGADVPHILDLGHKQPGAEAPLYGRHGHGQPFAFLALSNFTFWLGNSTHPDGERKRWIAVCGQQVVSKDGTLQKEVFDIPHGVNTLESMLNMEPQPFAQLNAFLQQWGKSKRAYISPYWEVKDLLVEFDNMQAAGDTLRAYIFLDHENYAKLNADGHDIILKDLGGKVSLKSSMPLWYMPILPEGAPNSLASEFKLRDHLQAPPLQILPQVYIQGSPLDWHAGWLSSMQACEASISPFDSPGLPAMSEVITLAHGDRMLKMQVLEKPKNAPTPGDGFVIFLDSDRHVKGPFVPAIIQSAREVYLRNLEKSAVSNTAYLNFLSMVQIEEEEAVAEGLPTRKQFLSTKGPFKAVLRRLGGFQVTTYVTVERAKVMERGLLINNKTEFAEAAAPMYVAIFKAMAKAVWARHCKQQEVKAEEERLEREAHLAQQHQRRAQQQQQQQQQEQEQQHQEQQQRQQQGHDQAAGEQQQDVMLAHPFHLSPLTPRQQKLKRQHEEREKSQLLQQQQQQQQESPAKKAKKVQPANLNMLQDLEKRFRTAATHIQKDIRNPLNETTSEQEQRKLQDFGAHELQKILNSFSQKLRGAAAACRNAAAAKVSNDNKKEDGGGDDDDDESLSLS